MTVFFWQEMQAHGIRVRASDARGELEAMPTAGGGNVWARVVADLDDGVVVLDDRPEKPEADAPRRRRR